MSEHIWLYTAYDGAWERAGASSVGIAASACVGPFSFRGLGSFSTSMVNWSMVQSSSSTMRVWRGGPTPARRVVITIGGAGKEVGVSRRDGILAGRLRRFGGCEAGDIDG